MKSETSGTSKQDSGTSKQDLGTSKQDSGTSKLGYRTGKDMTKGIKCRACGTTMFVYETRPGDNYIVRYRVCRLCNKKHKTVET